jgi:hypothetical protein
MVIFAPIVQAKKLKGENFAIPNVSFLTILPVADSVLCFNHLK